MSEPNQPDIDVQVRAYQGERLYYVAYAEVLRNYLKTASRQYLRNQSRLQASLRVAR